MAGALVRVAGVVSLPGVIFSAPADAISPYGAGGGGGHMATVTFSLAL